MDSTSSSTSRFRFRDHNQEMEDGESTDSDSPSQSIDGEVESMTGKGIKHLCSELLELKRETDEDFHKNISSNYSSFVRIFEEIEGMGNELMHLKHHVSTQKRLVKDLIDGIYLKVLSEETVESMMKGPLHEPFPLNVLETHTDDVSEILDTLLSEHRVEEALAFLEMEDGLFQSVQLKSDLSSDVLISYNSMILERKAMLADQLIRVAENPRVPPPELQKSLAGLCRLGDNHLAVKLLLKYYHSRVASGIRDLQSLETNLPMVYIREVAKFVFSVISQAARSFVVLHGETSPYTSELMQWAFEETEVFANCFNKYVKSITEISGGLSTAVEAVEFAMSYCSLLETQRIVLRPRLIKSICACMEEVLQIHIDHFKKVICIFTSTDDWVVGRYLVSGILNEDRGTSVVIGQQPEYCLLSNSGRKFVTLLQDITRDISPLVSLQMEGPILTGLIDLFMEYIVILERALTTDLTVIEKGGLRINLAESLAQQVSLISNLSTLVHLFSSIIRNVFKDINQLKSETDDYIQYIEEASGRLRSHFCKQFIHKIMTTEGYHGLTPENCIGNLNGSNRVANLVPSVSYQGLLIELRKLQKLVRDNFVEANWLMDLVTELMEAIFIWISSDKDIWTITEKHLTEEDSLHFMQFVLDIHFLVEIAKCEGYLTDNIKNVSLDMISRMESVFISAGLNPKRDVNDDAWAPSAANQTIQKLQDIVETEMLLNETDDNIEEETNELQSRYSNETFGSDNEICSLIDSVESMEDSATEDASEVSISGEPVSRIEVITHEDIGHEGEVSINTKTEILKVEAIDCEDVQEEGFQAEKLEESKLHKI